MFDQITERFDTVLRNLRGLGKITDKNIQETAREIRRVLLEADVNFQVTRDFVKRVQDRSAGTKVLKSVKGLSEETTTGIRALKKMEAEKKL